MKKTRLARTVATMAVAGAGLLALFPGVGSAVAPATGVACQADGKISGRGATFATTAWTTLANGYQSDICGPVPGGLAGNNMAVYNYTGAGTGSGQGQRATICRTDHFAGSDIPYDDATKALFDGPAGTLGALGGNCVPAVTPPYANGQTTFPAAADATAPVMSFPVAGSSVQIGINLQNANCGGTRPAAIQLTGAMMTDLLQGDIANWNDPALRAGGLNAGLANCNIAVRRVVRLDRSGTTQIQKNYLKNVDPTAAPTCNAAAANWTTLALDANNTTWPEGGTCTVLARGAANGAPSQIAACADSVNNPGAICYADFADMSAAAAAPLIKAQIRNSTNTSFQAAGTGTRANCSFSTIVQPGAGTAGAVGLDAGGDTWSLNNAAGNRGDVTNQGALYPICGLTFALVYTALNDGAVANPYAGMNANQRRTLYSFMTYVLSSAGQDRLTGARYNALGSTLLATVRNGFQANF